MKTEEKEKKKDESLIMRNKEGENAVPEREIVDETPTPQRSQASPTIDTEIQIW
jgi:hypothetical protein